MPTNPTFSLLCLFIGFSPPQNKRAVYTDVSDSSLCLNLIRCFESVCSPCRLQVYGLPCSSLLPPLLFISVSAHRLVGPDKLKSGWNIKNAFPVLQKDLIYKLCTICRLFYWVQKATI